MSSQDAPWDAGMAPDTDRMNWPFGPHARVRRTTDQTGIANSTFALITWTAVVYDYGGMWDAGSPTKLTVPTGKAGLYGFGCQMQWDDNDTGIRMVFLRVNGSTSYATDRKVAIDSTETALYTETYLAAGDYIEVMLLQSSGANRTVLGANALTLQNPCLFARRIHPTL